MTLILSGTNGVSDIDGDASTPALRGTDANSGIYFGSDTVGISAGGTQKLLIGTGSATIDGLTVGRGAGDVSTNTAVGASALAANEAGGTGNTAVGYQALDANTTGDGNTAIGDSALGANTTSSLNTAIGVDALKSQQTGTNVNVAIGYKALELGNNANNFNNVAVGGYALQDNIGSSNTAVGRNALTANTSASNNTAVGREAADAYTTGGGNTAIGAGAIGSGTTGVNNTACGEAAGLDITTGSGNIFIGHDAGRTGSPGGAVTTGNFQVCMGNNSITNAFIKVAWTVTSDAREKTNIGAVPHGLSFVNQLNPVSYQFRKSRDSDVPTGDLRYGFLAQDILTLEGDTPVIINNKNPDYLSYNGESLVPVLVNAIKELSAKNDALEARIAALEGN